jgi:hypothetical protein
MHVVRFHKGIPYIVDAVLQEGVDLCIVVISGYWIANIVFGSFADLIVKVFKIVFHVENVQ